MPPRIDVVRTPTPQMGEANASGSGSIRGEVAAGHQPGVPVPRVDGSYTLEQFLRLHSPSFKGEADPWGAESWLKKVTNIFEAMHTTYQRWLTLVTYLF